VKPLGATFGRRGGARAALDACPTVITEARASKREIPPSGAVLGATASLSVPLAELGEAEAVGAVLAGREMLPLLAELVSAGAADARVEASDLAAAREILPLLTELVSPGAADARAEPIPPDTIETPRFFSARSS